jgi:hypothetical protein
VAGFGAFTTVAIVAPKLLPLTSAISFLFTIPLILRQRAEERAECDRIAGRPPMPPPKPHRADNTAQAAEQTDTTTTNVGCPNCQHVQPVPRSQPTFVCELEGTSDAPYCGR